MVEFEGKLTEMTPKEIPRWSPGAGGRACATLRKNKGSLAAAEDKAEEEEEPVMEGCENGFAVSVQLWQQFAHLRHPHC